jgi:hypothetical protein
MRSKLLFDNCEFEIDLKNRPSIYIEEERCDEESGICKLKEGSANWQSVELTSENKIEWNGEKDIDVKIDFASEGQEHWRLFHCVCEFKENKSILNYKGCMYFLNK